MLTVILFHCMQEISVKTKITVPVDQSLQRIWWADLSDETPASWDAPCQADPGAPWTGDCASPVTSLCCVDWSYGVTSPLENSSVEISAQWRDTVEFVVVSADSGRPLWFLSACHQGEHSNSSHLTGSHISKRKKNNSSQTLFLLISHSRNHWLL